jgi:hypothetical protein
MFQSSCFESSESKDENGQTWWTGKTCEGGGSYALHRMNQDTMTPSAVAFVVGHRDAILAIKRIRAKAEEEAHLAAEKAYRLETKVPPIAPASLPILVRSVVTVAELKAFIADWPETDTNGEPTEVWVETGQDLTSPCTEVWPLNLRIRGDGTPTSDLCFNPAPAAWNE